MQTLLWIQDSALGTWLRESDWAIFACLIAHTLGMAFAVGVCVIVAARSLGAISSLPLQWLPTLRPLLNYALLVVLISGAGLVIGYPAKALTNPLFYVKLLALGSAAFISYRQLSLLAQLQAIEHQRAWALLSCMGWIGGVVAGKLLAYTHTMLLVYE